MFSPKFSGRILPSRPSWIYSRKCFKNFGPNFRHAKCQNWCQQILPFSKLKKNLNNFVFAQKFRFLTKKIDFLLHFSQNFLTNHFCPKFSNLSILPNIFLTNKFRFLTKILMSDTHFDFRHLTKILIFDQNSDFWPKFWFLLKTFFSYPTISIPDRKFQFLIETFDSWPKFRLLTKISILNQNFDF